MRMLPQNNKRKLKEPQQDKTPRKAHPKGIKRLSSK
jgi:hypothetical protein